MKFAGHLDLCGPRLIEGWLYCDFAPTTPVRLQVWVEDMLLGECEVDRFRLDLKDAGFGDGFCGFSFPVPETAGNLTYAQTRLRLLDAPIFLLPSQTTVVEQPVARDGGEPAEFDVSTQSVDDGERSPEVSANGAGSPGDVANDPEVAGETLTAKLVGGAPRGKAPAFWKKG